MADAVVDLRPDAQIARAGAPTYDEKNPQDQDVDRKSDSEEEEAITDLFASFPPAKGVAHEENPLTARAVLIGIVLGSLVNASNVYLGEHLQTKLDAT